MYFILSVSGVRHVQLHLDAASRNFAALSPLRHLRPDRHLRGCQVNFQINY